MTKAARYRWEARAAGIVQGVASILPLRLVRAFGRALGRLLSDLDPRHVAIATANLRQAFPHWDADRRLRTATANETPSKSMAMPSTPKAMPSSAPLRSWTPGWTSVRMPS